MGINLEETRRLLGTNVEETIKVILRCNSSDSNQIVSLSGTAANIAEFVSTASEHNLVVEHITETRLIREFERILDALPKKKKGLGNHGTVWTPAEDEILVAQFKDGMSIHDIAVAHERSNGSIRERLKMHKLIEGKTMTELRQEAYGTGE